jgi:hypothetical protein
VARLRRAREKMYWFLAAMPPKTNTFFRFQSEALDFAQALSCQILVIDTSILYGYSERNRVATPSGFQ